jgi:CHAT domain-containing protein
MLRCFLLILVLVSPLRAQTQLEPGKTLHGEISAGAEDTYQIILSKDDFASVVVEQMNVDIVMHLQDGAGKEILICDQESRNQGTERLDLIAEQSGNYKLKIRPALKNAMHGRYQIHLEKILSAKDDDRLLFQARQGLCEASRMAEKGNFDDALPIAEQSVGIFEQTWGREIPELAKGLSLIANIRTGKEEYEEAEPVYLRALEIREKVLGAEHPAVAESCVDIARLYSNMEDQAKAESYASRAVMIREKTLDSNHFLTGYALMDYGNYLLNSQKFEKSKEMLNRALSILENSIPSDQPQFAKALHSVGYLFDTLGDFTTALQFYQRELVSAEHAKGKESMQAAKVLNYIARIYYWRGQYEDAEGYYQRALEINQKLNDENGILVAQSNLANIYLARGDYERSEETYKEILEKRENATKPNPMRIAHALVSLGEINNSKGDYVAAESFLKRSMSIAETIWKGDRSELGDILTRLATSYIGLKDYSSAEQASRRALAIYEKTHGPEHSLVAEALNVLGQIAVLKSDFDAAELLFRRSISITEKVESLKSPTLLEPLNGLAEVYTKRNDIAQAVQYQSRANEVVEHNLALAIAAGSERQKLSSLIASASNMSRNIAFHINSAPEDSKAAELAATAILRFKGRVLDSMADSFSSLRSHSNPKDQNLLDQLNESASQLGQRILYAPELSTSAESRELEEKIEKLQDQISRSNAEFSSQKQPVTIDSIRNAIPNKAVLIEFALYRPTNGNDLRYVAYVIRNQGQIYSKELGNADEVDKAVDDLRQSLRDPSLNNVKQFARLVHQKIIQPILPFIENAEHLLISPDGELNLFPFEVLVDQENQYLVENFLCSYLTSGRDLLRLQFPRQSETAPVLVANPMFGPRNINKQEIADAKLRSVTTASDLSKVYFAPLSGTGGEARAIKTFFNDANVFTGKDATESKLKQIEAPRILHIATHGFFLTDIPSDKNEKASIENPLLRSGLAFAGANARQSGKDDGILTALEASGLNLWGTKLVTLSACDTGLGPVKNGEGVYGLRRAFFLSGTESLVMSLWSVSDYTTREIMTSYYKNLKQGLGRAEALRLVKLDMLKHQRRAHPFFWASFIQSGQWLPL